MKSNLILYKLYIPRNILNVFLNKDIPWHTKDILLEKFPGSPFFLVENICLSEVSLLRTFMHDTREKPKAAFPLSV